MRQILILLGLCVSLQATNIPNQIVVRLAVGATSAVLNDSVSGTSVTIPFATSGSQRVLLILGPGKNTPSDTGTFTFTDCANPCGTGATASLMTGDLSTGDWYRWGKYVGVSGAAWTDAGTFIRTLTIPQIEVATVTTSPLPMPRLIIGQDQYAAHHQLSVASTATSLRHLVRYDNYQYPNTQVTTPKIYTQINSKIPSTGATGWEGVTTSSATILDQFAYWGTVRQNVVGAVYMTMPITSGVVTTGNNIFGSKFAGTDGITSGFRILAENVIEPDVEITTCTTTSNITECTTGASHGWSTGYFVFVHGMNGPWGRLNGIRTITVTAVNKFSFVPCGTNPNMLSCTSPNGTVVPPTSQFTSEHPQPHAYAARALIDPAAFTWTDYSAFAAPGGSDASAGQTLWETAALVVPNAPYQGNATVATCGSCHAQDGRDLKYLAYENYTIRARSVFHGLTKQNGDDIAAYIRGLNVERPPMGYPWSPLYQPGPGIDSQAWWYWSAGAGLDNVLMYSNDWVECTAPSGSFTQWRYNGNFPVRTCPIIEPLFTWNKWLPTVYAPDVFPTTSTDFATVLTNLAGFRSALVAGKQTGTINTSATTLVMTANFACSTNDVLSIENEAVQVTAGCGTTSLTITRHTNSTSAANHTDANVGDFTKYKTYYDSVTTPNLFPYGPYRSSVAVTGAGFPSNGDNRGDIPPANETAGYIAPSPFMLNFYSLAQFNISKLWDLHHTYYLEGMMALYLQDRYGNCTACPGGAWINRGVVGNTPFYTAFHLADTQSHVNSYGTEQAFATNTNIWYQFAELYFNGQGVQSGNNPIDQAYYLQFMGFNQSELSAPLGPELMLEATAQVQANAQNPVFSGGSFGPPILAQLSTHSAVLFQFVYQRFAFVFMSDAEMKTMIEEWVDEHNAIRASQTDMQWSSWLASPTSCCAAMFAVDVANPAGDYYVGNGVSIAGGIAYILPIARYYSVTSAKLDTLQTWGELLAPAVDFAAQRAATCTPQGGNPRYLKCSNVP